MAERIDRFLRRGGYGLIMGPRQVFLGKREQSLNRYLSNGPATMTR
jgi:hypothetical protein